MKQITLTQHCSFIPILVFKAGIICLCCYAHFQLVISVATTTRHPCEKPSSLRTAAVQLKKQVDGGTFNQLKGREVLGDYFHIDAI